MDVLALERTLTELDHIRLSLLASHPHPPGKKVQPSSSPSFSSPTRAAPTQRSGDASTDARRGGARNAWRFQ